MKCTYCLSDVSGNYCSHCGQPVINRFTWSMAMGWIRDEVFVLDRGFFYSVKELLVRPVTTINNYLKGNTRRYINPFKLLAILSTSSIAIVMFNADNEIVPLDKIVTEGPPAFSSASFDHILFNWPNLVVPNLIYHFMITTVLVSLASRALFRKRGLNFIEHLIFVCFMTSYFVLINYCVLPIYLTRIWLSEIQFVTIVTPTFVFLLCTIVVTAKRFFQENYWKVILKGILCLYGSIILSVGLQLMLLSLAKKIYEQFG